MTDRDVNNDGNVHCSRKLLFYLHIVVVVFTFNLTNTPHPQPPPPPPPPNTQNTRYCVYIIPTLFVPTDKVNPSVTI